MDPNNSGFIVEDELNESDFTAISSIGGMDLKQIVEKIQKLEDMCKKNANSSNNVDQSGMMQIVWQMGKEIGELKKENEGLKDGMSKMMKAFEELKKENDGLKEEKGHEMEGMKKTIEGMKGGKESENHRFEELKEDIGLKMREMTKLIAQFGGKNAELEGKIVENNDELKAAFNGFKNEIGGKNAELMKKIIRLKEEEEKLKEKMAELQGKMEKMAKSTEKIGGVEWVKYDWRAFKLDSAHCGPRLTISEGGFAVKHSDPADRMNTVLANLPIPSFIFSAINKSKIAFYFEVQFLKNGYDIEIGFCTQQFPLEGSWLRNGNNSIGIWNKGEIWIDGTETEFENADEYFNEGDFVGIGIIHKPNSKMECFATLNGQLLGKAALPSKFLDLPLFPAVNLFVAGDSIRANFDKENCQFKEFGLVLQ